MPCAAGSDIFGALRRAVGSSVPALLPVTRPPFSGVLIPLTACEQREVSPRYGEGFGKRPDALLYPVDVRELARKTQKIATHVTKVAAKQAKAHVKKAAKSAVKKAARRSAPKAVKHAKRKAKRR